MTPMADKLLYLAIGVVATVIVVVAVVLFTRRKATAQVALTTTIDQQALNDAANALLIRAKAEAQGDEAMKKIATIEQIKDPTEKLKQLTEQLKGV